MPEGGEGRPLRRLTAISAIFAGKPILRGHRLAVEHVLGMLAAGDTPETILQGYAWLAPDDLRARLVYARRVVGQAPTEPALTDRSVGRSCSMAVSGAAPAVRTPRPD